MNYVKTSCILFFCIIGFLMQSFTVCAASDKDDSVIAFWEMDKAVKRGSSINIPDSSGAKKEYPLELNTTVMSSDSPAVKMSSPELTSGGKGVTGEALVFDKSYAIVRDIWQGYDSVVLDFWMNIRDLPKSRGVPVIYLLRTGTWDLTFTSNNELQWTARNSAGSAVGYLRQSVAEFENEWIHVIAMFDADLTMRLIVNGNGVSTIAKDMWWIRKNDSIQIGYLTGREADRSFSGMLDNIKVIIPAKEKTAAVSQGLQLHEAYGAVVVDNGVLRLEFDKAAARVVSLQKEGKELMRVPGGTGLRGTGQTYHQRIAYDHGNPPSHAHQAFSIPKYCKFRVLRETTDLIELSFVEDDPDFFPFYFDSRFVIRKGESGFYNYVVLEYQPEKVSRACLQQLNLALRVNPEIFTIEQVSDDRWHLMPRPKDIGTARVVMDATYELPESSIYYKKYNERVYSKYNMTALYENHHVHGTCSEGDGYGIWFINASAEYLNGGPVSQELTVHQTETTPFMIGSYQDVHFGSERLFFEASGGAWRKIFGPLFIYVNEGSGRENLWNDAKTETQKHIAQWPYQWMDDPEYAKIRGSVSGSLSIKDGTPAANALIVLAEPKHSETDHWHLQGKKYTFWTRTDEDGNFSIKNVTAGEYTVYISAPGVIGEFMRDGIRVSAGEDTVTGLLEWEPERYGKTAWEIGVADWDSTEFRSGDDFRHWGGEMRDRFVKNFPAGIDFKIGKDDWSAKWNYSHLRVPDNPQLDTWSIRFDLDHIYTGTTYLRFAIAGSRYAGLKIRINEQQIGEINDLNGNRTYAGQGYPRSGSRGYYDTVTIPFDSAILKPGENILALELIGTAGFEDGRNNVSTTGTVGGGDPFRNIHYDYIRLELPDSSSH